jgi:para-nitrobenzyl esterase
MTVVDTTSGPVRGLEQDGLLHFRGIRYAAPPIGALRFRPPQPAASWTEPADATGFGAVSVQDADPLSLDVAGTEAHFYPEGSRADEDCLFLNVITPAQDGGRPVLVWIHGGAYEWGSGSGGWFDGTRFAAEHDVVVVTLNYRLGVLGFAWLEDYEEGAGNLGIRDQIAALAWVRDNIARFGGDPTRVGIVGESAGGGSVLSLLASPLAVGLFSRAVVESGTLGQIAAPANGATTTAALLEQLQIAPDRDDVMAGLRRTSLFRLQAAQRALTRRPGPVAGGAAIADDPHAGLLASAARGVPLIIGSNADEHSLRWVSRTGATPFDARAIVLAAVGGDPARADGVLRSYVDVGSDPIALGDAVATDRDWAAPVRRLAVDYAAAGGAAFLYRFAWRSDANPRVGAGHFLEIPFVFGTIEKPGVADLLGPRSASEGAIRLAETMNAYWASFVADGIPAADHGPEWPRVDPDAPSMLLLDDPAAVLTLSSARLDIWDPLADGAG